MSASKLARILLVSSLCLSGGCVRGFLTPLITMGQWAESHQDLKEDRQQLLAEERDLLQAERRAAQAERVGETRAFIQGQKNCKGETVPEVESKIELPFRQQFHIGPPELDVEEMKERLRVMEDTHAKDLEEWRRQMADFRSREQEHYREQSQQREQFREQLKNGGCANDGRICGCGHVHNCGCANAPQCGCPQPTSCPQCQKGPTCAVTPRGIQPFTEQPPQRPRQSLLANEVPIKLRLRLVNEIGETEIEETRVRRAPVREQVQEQPGCNRCGKQSCDCTRRIQYQTPSDDNDGIPPVTTDERSPPKPLPDVAARGSNTPQVTRLPDAGRAILSGHVQ